MQKPSLTVILGAGFSRPAGLPLASDIKKRFDRDQRQNLLRFGSGEWMWKDEKSEIDINNGKMNTDSSVYGYILNEVIKKYKLEHSVFIDYEHFYQWIQDIVRDKRLKEYIYQKAKDSFLQDHPNFMEFVPEYDGDIHPFLYRFKNDSDLSNILEIINYLIADLISIKKPQFLESLSNYEVFVNYLRKFEEVDIFSLNHDLLLENILQYFGSQYSRGFTKEKSEIRFQDNDAPIAVFKNLFDKPVRLYKLHGSIDYYRFEHYVQGDKPYLQYTGNYNYFTTNNYKEKHFAVRVNPENGKLLQETNFNVVPKFITGTNKTEIIKNDLMYTELFNRFELCVSKAENILISGYSYRDKHINKELEKRNDVNVINQNPFNRYPFSCRHSFNIPSLKDLK
ncbi:SIR2 family protein [Flagellimonas sediminis]|uniref:Uncharacterized protein n=1 Tax=Flagellimonas sediminis TaxID=2696468 RepID=A0A6I5KQ96_9FLAO|nr:SIR2 family protein [Allomuricauda sediminis]NDV42065.1 hypothetical protein [Allomuricauda sediminis]